VSEALLKRFFALIERAHIHPRPGFMGLNRDLQARRAAKKPRARPRATGIGAFDADANAFRLRHTAAGRGPHLGKTSPGRCCGAATRCAGRPFRLKACVDASRTLKIVSKRRTCGRAQSFRRSFWRNRATKARWPGATFKGARADNVDFLKTRLKPMNRRRRIYEGKAKVLYEGPEPGTLIQHFKDDATAFNAKKHEVVDGKGVLNNRISEYIFQQLNSIGVPTHFIRRLNMREQLIREVEIIPLEVVVRNVAAGSLSKRLGLEEGTQLPRSIIEFYYKNDALDDPMVSEEHITAFGWATPQEIDDIMALAIRVNDFLSGLFLGVGIRLVDFKMECGRLWEGDMMRIVVADEISPDSCRLWDIKSNDKLDKDRFRRDMGGLVEAYSEVARRLGIMQDGEPPRTGGPKLVQ
jgi:phosphoribosylaminoimidazole-succinocarboxamide synthase